jgi:hypothetical protein
MPTVNGYSRPHNSRSLRLTWNERLSVPRRFFRICGCRPRPESYPEDTHKEHRDRVIWLSRPKDVQAESLRLPYLVPKEGTHIHRMLLRGQARP